MATFKNMTEGRVAEIAALHGFDWSDENDRKHIICEAKQADENHGKIARRPNGEIIVSWGTDNHGVYHADKLFDGYLAQLTYEAECDDRALSQFHRDAYGED